MRPVTWAQDEVDLVGLHRQPGIIKIPHKPKYIVKNFFWQEDGFPCQRGQVFKHM